MPLAPVAAGDARVTETPNATMTTLASPTQGGASLSMWRTVMRPGQQGPRHSFDVEQVWHVLTGTARVVTADESLTLSAGDTVVIPAGVVRQVGTDAGAEFVVACAPGALATPWDQDGPGAPVSPAWVA